MVVAVRCVCGCIAASEPGQLTVIDGTMMENIRPSVRVIKLKRWRIMQQDNNSKDTSKSKEKNKLKFWWSRQSSDLNPIKMLLCDIKQAVHAYKALQCQIGLEFVFVCVLVEGAGANKLNHYLDTAFCISLGCLCAILKLCVW